MGAVADAVSAGVLPGRVWMYSNYHCNLECTYCLTESSLGSERRHLSSDAMMAIALEAQALGFDGLGITGGEPFIRADMPEVVAGLADVLPVVVLSNGTLFTESKTRSLASLAGRPAAIQLSLDSVEAGVNDAKRGERNYANVLDAIRRLVAVGVRVRVATTIDPDEPPSASDAGRLCELHRRLGVSDDDHVVRPIVRRGRAASRHLGVAATPDDLPPELTVTADGAYWSPFGPTVQDGRLATDLLLTRTIRPLATPAEALLRLVEGRPPGVDAQLGIR